VDSIGRADAGDSEILDYAREEQCVVFTHDLDFGTLLALLKANRPSVIQVRFQDIMPSAVGELVIHALHAAREQLEAGALVTIDAARRRIRLLPI